MDLERAEQVIHNHENGNSYEDTCVVEHAFVVVRCEQISIQQMKNAYPMKFKTIDWGSRPRGQGKRNGHMIRGSMSDVTIQGKKSYQDRALQFGLEGIEGEEVNLLKIGEYMRYWKARTAGYKHDIAMLFAYDD